MAGERLYSNEMLGDVMAKVDALIAKMQDNTTTMSAKVDAQIAKMDAQISKMDGQTTALNNINTSVTQNLASVNVKVGNAKTVTFLGADTQISGATNEVVNAITFVALCNGSVTIRFWHKPSNKDYGTWPAYSINGVAVVSPTMNSTVNYVETTAVIAVKVGDKIGIGAKIYAAGYNAWIKAGVTISYSLADIVNDGAFA